MKLAAHISGTKIFVRSSIFCSYPPGTLEKVPGMILSADAILCTSVLWFWVLWPGIRRRWCKPSRRTIPAGAHGPQTQNHKTEVHKMTMKWAAFIMSA